MKDYGKTMSIQDVSFQGGVPAKEKRRNTNIAIVSAPLLVACDIATEGALTKGNRKDTFVETAKSCAKSFNKDRKNTVAWFCKKVLRNEDLAKKVFNISNNNKKMFATFFAVETLIAFAMIKLLSDWGSKWRHKE